LQQISGFRKEAEKINIFYWTVSIFGEVLNKFRVVDGYRVRLL